MLLEFLTLILTFTFVESCPASVSSTNRCTCHINNSNKPRITCSGIDEERQLVNSLREYKGLNIGYLKLQNVVLLYIPHDVFQGMNIEEMVFQNCSIMSLSNTDVAFEGLDSSLTHLEFVYCGFTNEWNWSVLKNLGALKSLRFTSGDLLTIDNSMATKLGNLNNLGVVTFNFGHIFQIEDYAFANLTRVYELDLQYNSIKELKRSMFPNPAVKLQYFFFGHNELRTLPDDLFSNMPSLDFIELSHNKLLTLKEATFAPVWNYLNRFETAGNDLRCDCRMKWILEKRRHPDMTVICQHPTSLRGKELIDLDPVNLYC